MTATPDLQNGFEIGPFSVLPERNIVSLGEHESHLEPKQMKALVALARHQPGVVSKEMLIDEVWDGRNTSDESITGCIRGLRAALDNDSPRSPKYVETIHGRGYRLIVPVVSQQPASVNVEVPRTWLPRLIAVVAIVAVGLVWFLWPPPPAPSPSIDSVVITRFANMSSEATQPTVDGITEQLVSTLYEVPNLQIKKGNLPGDDETARDIADRYGVGWVVFGSVQQMDGEVKIIARIEDRDSVVEWADTFTGTDSQVFHLHEQVATSIRDEIRGEEEHSVSASSTPASSEAYGRFLLGQFYLAKRDPVSLNRAVDYFDESIAMDRNYGPAYLALANTFLLLADYGEREARFDLAIATADAGVELDPEIQNAAQTVHGYVYSKRGEWTAAAAAFDIATSGMAEFPVTHHYHSESLADVGRIDASLDAAIRAWEMEPDSQVLNSRLAISYFWKNEMENARRHYDIANTLSPGSPISQLSYALFLVRDGRVDEAREFVRRAMSQLNEDPSWVDPVFDELGRTTPSSALTAMLAEYAAQDVIPPSVLITFWALAGQPEQAIDIAWRLVDDPGLFDIELIYLDEFRDMRRQDDFARLTEQLGLQAYWNNAGCRWQNDQLRCPGD